MELRVKTNADLHDSYHAPPLSGLGDGMSGHDDTKAQQIHESRRHGDGSAQIAKRGAARSVEALINASPRAGSNPADSLAPRGSSPGAAAEQEL